MLWEGESIYSHSLGAAGLLNLPDLVALSLLLPMGSSPAVSAHAGEVLIVHVCKSVMDGVGKMLSSLPMEKVRHAFVNHKRKES